MHKVEAGASEAAREQMERMLGSVEGGERAFYERHDGMRMYIDTQWSNDGGHMTKAVGMVFYPVGLWTQKTAKFQAQMAAMGWLEDDQPGWMKSGVVFGEIPYSANYFVLGKEGQDAGRVFYAYHDNFTEEPLARNFDALLGMIVEDPAAFLNKRGCFTRYSDGKTDTQWIPKRYRAGG
jgi:hypothetical protein